MTVRPFGYLRDPLFLVCLVLYFLNRFVGKPLTGGGFLHEHFNDLICIPFWLPILLWFSKKAGLRKTNAPPLLIEVLVPTAGWSMIFEFWLPMLSSRFVGDPWDMTWYLLGGMGAYYVWRFTTSPGAPARAQSLQKVP